MIRFNCPNCGRHYELSPAFAFLPLVCKQCGQHITPPAAEPDPPPPPAPAPPKPVPPIAKVAAHPPAKAAPAPKSPVVPSTVAKPSVAKPPLPPDDDEDDDDGILITKPDSTPDIDFNVGGPTAASLSDASRTPSAKRAVELQGTSGSISSTEPNSVPDINLDRLGPEPPPPPKRAPRPPEPEPPEARPEPTLVPFVADLVVFVVLVVAGMLVGEVLARKDTGTVLSEAGSAAKFPPVDLLLWGGPPVLLALIYLLLGGRERTVGAWLRRRAGERETPGAKPES